MLEICSDLFKTCLKIYYFCQHSKKAKKWPNGQTILFLANSFKKGQMATLKEIVTSQIEKALQWGFRNRLLPRIREHQP